LEDINVSFEERRLVALLIRDIETVPILSRDEEREIAKQCRQGDEEALNKLIEANTKFVIEMAFQYWRPGLPLMDMISEGLIGLMESARSFEPALGFRLLTYAQRAIEWRIIALINDCNKHKHISLDEPIHDDDETTLKDMILSEETPPDKTCFHKELTHFLYGLIHCLNERERKVIWFRFWHDLTLDVIGLRIGVKKERIRQIEDRALMKLRRAAHYAWGGEVVR
jgi:RNA polymerase primary sigma factor